MSKKVEKKSIKKSLASSKNNQSKKTLKSSTQKSRNQTNSSKKASNNVSTTSRQWLVLSLLERGKWRGTKYIQEQLSIAGYEVTIRTVQRDLVALADKFLLEKNNANPQGWRWRDDAPLQSMPNMNLSQAVAFNMVQANLMQLLPPAILKELYPWFDLANRQLKENNAMKSWLNKVHIEPATQPLIAPTIETTVKNDIYQAVFEKKQIEVSYTGRNKDEAKKYHLNPLAIVQRGVIIYLLATKFVIDTEEQLKKQSLMPYANKKLKETPIEEGIRFFTLHRFDSVKVLDEPAVIPDDFDLNSYVETGAMGFREARFDELPNKGKFTNIELVFSKIAGNSLTESKLSENQIVTEHEDGTITVFATVNLTMQLVWWLRGFGKGLIDAKPKLLLDVVRDEN